MSKQLVKIAFYSVILASSFVVSCKKKEPKRPPVVTGNTTSGEVLGSWMKYTYDPVSNQLRDSIKVFDKATVKVDGMNVILNSESLGKIQCQIFQIGSGFIELTMEPQLSKFKNLSNSDLYWSLYNASVKPRLYKDKIEGLHLKLTTDAAGKNPIFADYRLEKY